MDKKELDSTSDPILFPLEILIEILSRLPAKPLVRFKCVSKQWSGLINSPYFIKLQMSHTLSKNSTGTLILRKGSSLYTLDFHNPDCHATTLHYPEKINLCEPDRLVGSCNGLLCFTFKDDHQLALYNPVTRAYKILPELPKRRYRKYRDKVELAYDRISDDYKVLCVRSEDRERYTFLYNLSNNAWEIILNPPWSRDSVKSQCVMVNNSLHWMDHELREIKCFDLFTRRYYEILLPDKINPGYKPTLAVLGGQLCVVTFYFDLWILKEYDVQESWTRIFRCSSSQWNSIYKSCSGFSNWGSGLSLACSKDGSKIFVAEHKKFLCCDLESQEATIIKIPGLPTTNGFSTILPWVALLTLLE